MTRFAFCAASSLIWGGMVAAVPFYSVQDNGYFFKNPARYIAEFISKIPKDFYQKKLI